MKQLILLAFCAVLAQAAIGQSQGKGADTTAATAFRMHYDDLFRHNADNSVSPKRALLINGEVVNTDTKIANGVKYGGIIIADWSGHDALVDTQKNAVIIRKFLK